VTLILNGVANALDSLTPVSMVLQVKTGELLSVEGPFEKISGSGSASDSTIVAPNGVLGDQRRLPNWPFNAQTANVAGRAA